MSRSGNAPAHPIYRCSLLVHFFDSSFSHPWCPQIISQDEQYAQNPLSEAVRGILYATEEGFEAPAEGQQEVLDEY
eukprot:m.312482 g.312482  ORF g.312482 m.312482 type:complete len:76 (-) comp55387_c0_seq2:175-402(-)